MSRWAVNFTIIPESQVPSFQIIRFSSPKSFTGRLSIASTNLAKILASESSSLAVGVAEAAEVATAKVARVTAEVARAARACAACAVGVTSVVGLRLLLAWDSNSLHLNSEFSSLENRCSDRLRVNSRGKNALSAGVEPTFAVLLRF